MRIRKRMIMAEDKNEYILDCLRKAGCCEIEEEKYALAFCRKYREYSYREYYSNRRGIFYMIAKEDFFEKYEDGLRHNEMARKVRKYTQKENMFKAYFACPKDVTSMEMFQNDLRFIMIEESKLKKVELPEEEIIEILLNEKNYYHFLYDPNLTKEEIEEIKKNPEEHERLIDPNIIDIKKILENNIPIYAISNIDGENYYAVIDAFNNYSIEESLPELHPDFEWKECDIYVLMYYYPTEVTLKIMENIIKKMKQ